MKKAFTLIEILIVMSILAVIISFSSYFYTKFSRGDFILDEATNLVVFVLKIAREKAMIDEENTSWGVYLENNSNSPDRIYLFKGNPNNRTDIFELPRETTFDGFTNQTILFQRLSGETSSTTIKLGFHEGNRFRWIIIPQSGAFTVTSTQP